MFNQKENSMTSSAWKVDPCSDKGVQDYWKIFHGSLDFFWQHQSNEPGFVVSFSKVEYGEMCESDNKHTCSRSG